MKVFIIPYRNREGQLQIFLNHMKYLLEDLNTDDYRIYIVNQVDKRPFNRGGMRNIGFLEAKKEFPDTYKDIDFVFHDLDNLVGKKNIVKFTTEPNEVNHIFGNYIGYNIGGIFVMKGRDFEKINGYPNFWGWGSEDEELWHRCSEAKMKIIRDKFSWKDPRVVHLDHSNNIPATLKVINTFNMEAMDIKKKHNKRINDGLHTLRDITIYKRKMSPSVNMFNVTVFKCNMNEKNYNPVQRWMISTNFDAFLRKYVQRRVSILRPI